MPGWIYGGAGIIFAGIFWWICRDRPAEHPACNAAERELIERDQDPELREPTGARPIRTPWRGLLTSRDMWLMCLYQFLTNVGWVFLVTLMPKFLSTAKGLSEGESGKMSSIALLIGGLGGMLVGGWLTDSLTRSYGVRLGRMIPMVWSRLAGAAAYLICLALDSPWVAVAAFATVAAMTDISIPAAWGYVQDVGGRNIASTYAWPNMWGNFGAALTPSILTWLNSTFDPHHNWHASLIFLAIAFFLSGFAAYWIRADVKIEPAVLSD
jgi:nitrate/nitrite transporter NarK